MSSTTYDDTGRSVPMDTNTQDPSYDQSTGHQSSSTTGATTGPDTHDNPQYSSTIQDPSRNPQPYSSSSSSSSSSAGGPETTTPDQQRPNHASSHPSSAIEQVRNEQPAIGQYGQSIIPDEVKDDHNRNNYGGTGSKLGEKISAALDFPGMNSSKVPAQLKKG